MASWEYLTVSETTSGLDKLGMRINALGLVGWEVCGFAAADKTVGFNAYTAILRRERASFPPPEDLAAAWKPDPAKHGQYRFWDGLRWSEHISTDNVKTIDYPMA